MKSKSWIATAVVVAAFAAPVRAELRYTMHVESRPSSVKTAVDPTLSAIAGLVLQNMLPGGATDVSYLIRGDGARIEATKEMPGLPAGTYMIIKADGAAFIVRPTDKSFWKVTGRDMGSALPGGPTVKETKTGQKATVAGVPTERVGMEIRLPVPRPAGVEMPANMPKEYVINADKWVTFQFDEKYHAMLGTTGRLMGLSAADASAGNKGGFVMRQILRGSMFGDQEVEMVVTKISDVPDAGAAWTVPAGYREVPAPAGRTGGGR